MSLEELRLILAGKLAGSEFEGKAWFAGGCVRDALLGRIPAKLDADIAVELPAGGVRLAGYLQKLLPTPEPVVRNAFGTASTVYEGVQLDFVMTRSEIYAPGSRHPRVRFAPLAKDCQRRDFTVNALYQNIQTGLVTDPCGRGLADLEAKVISCVREAGAALEEDPLRILRALRFAAVLGFDLAPETLAAIKGKAPLVACLSRQRCRDELARLEANADAGGRQTWMSLLESTGVRPYLEKRTPLISLS